MTHKRSISRWLCLTLIVVSSTAFADDKALRWKGDVDVGADKSFRPIVFVHGFAGSGEQYERPAKLFASNGYPPTWINVYDYNSTGPAGGPELLDEFIDRVRARTGFDKVDLVGHSRGTGISKKYLGDSARAAKVAHYANVGGGGANNVGGVPTIVVGSKGDKLAGPGSAKEGARHALLEKPDHVGVCTGSESFKHIFTFFNDGKEPKTVEVCPQEPIAVGGFAKIFGPNTPLTGATLEVYELVAETGRRIHSRPDAKFLVRDDGGWGPFRAKPGQHYELCLIPVHGQPIHFYREPFERTDLLVYLKARDEKDAATAKLMKELNASDDSSLLVVTQLDGAIVAGRDSLKVNGVQVATEKIAPASGTKVGFYIFDANGNKKTDATRPEGSSWSRPFITAADVFIQAVKPESVTLEFNGRILHVPNWKGASEGLIFVTFN